MVLGAILCPRECDNASHFVGNDTAEFYTPRLYHLQIFTTVYCTISVVILVLSSRKCEGRPVNPISLLHIVLSTEVLAVEDFNYLAFYIAATFWLSPKAHIVELSSLLFRLSCNRYWAPCSRSKNRETHRSSYLVNRINSIDFWCQVFCFVFFSYGFPMSSY